MVAGVKVAKKAKVVAPDTDSESELSANGMDDDQHLSDDEEFPMSEDEYIEEDGGQEGEAAASKWALTMAKYLRKTSDAKILSKATKEADLERKRKEPKPTYKFEVVGAEDKPTQNEDKDEKEDKPADVEIARELLRQKALMKKERQKDILGLRVRPSIGDYERERALKKIATKGTVQLFNAVRQQQKDVNQKLADAGKLEYKREKVLKNLSKKEFLNVLMNGPRAKSELVDNLVKKEEEGDVKDEVKSEDDSAAASDDGDEPKSTWGALRADFLTGKKSGWDKEQEEEDGDRDKAANLEGNMGGESSDSD